MSATAIKLPTDFISHIRVQAETQHRSVPKQIQYLSEIGEAVLKNPDLPYSMIQNILEAQREYRSGAKLEEYTFG